MAFNCAVCFVDPWLKFRGSRDKKRFKEEERMDGSAKAARVLAHNTYCNRVWSVSFSETGGNVRLPFIRRRSIVKSRVTMNAGPG